MSASLHVPDARIGLLVSAFAVASAMAAIPVTAVLRGLPRRAVLIGALTGFALCDAATALSLQTALIGASGPASADVATALQTTVYNVGIAAGSLFGGIILDRAGRGSCPGERVRWSQRRWR